MKTNAAGLSLIKSAEGLRLRAYQDSVGVWTIGFGRTRGVKQGQKITEAEATEFLKSDLESAEADVTRLVRVVVTENQFAALVSFVFNLGAGALKRSTLLKKLNLGDMNGAAVEFLKWNKAGQKILAGLTKRRQAEMTLFQS